MPATIFQGAYVKMLKDKLKFKEGGIIEWDHTNGCPSYPSDIAGVNNQIGQELHVRVYNGTGSTITNGSIVYLSGVDPDGNHPSVALAIANDYAKSRVMGMVTADILDGDHGIVTKEGLVNRLDTSAYSSGDVLYLSPTIAGAYQSTTVDDGNFDVRVGAVVEDDATTGSILVCALPTQYTVETTQKTGWSQYGMATISFVDGTRTLTLTPVGSEFHFYQMGTKYAKTTDSFQITDVEGVHFIYYNGSVLTEIVNPTDGQISSAIQNYTTVAYVGWDATNKLNTFIGNELHDMQFPDQVHLYAHFAFGARYLNGLGPNSIIAEGNGSLDSHAQFGMDGGAIADEDIYIPTSSIASTTGLPIFYLAGTTASPTLRKTTQAGFAVKTTGTGRLAYNFLTGGNWTIAEVPNTNFVLCHVFCINENDIAKRVISFMGQAQYATVALARAGASTEISTLVTTGIIPKEIKSIATFVFQTADAYTNSVNARVREISTGVNYEDWRSVNNTGGSAATGGGGTTIFSDANFQVFDDADPTKSFQFQASGITTATNRILSVPNETTTLMGTTTPQTMTNKTRDDAITEKQIATPSTPAAGYNKSYPGTDGIPRTLLPSGKEIAVDTKGDYEFLWDKQLSDFVLYDDGATAVPVDGTGGSPSTLTLISSPSPIDTSAGVLNLRLSKSAADGQGEGVGVVFNVRGSIDYSAVRVCKVWIKGSANHADNDVGFYLKPIDGSDTSLIYPSDQNVKASSFVSAQQFEFQLRPDSTQYRLILHVQSTNALAYDLDFVVKVVETKKVTGGIVNWPSYTMTVTGADSWVTKISEGIPYKTINGDWRLRFNVTGDVSSATRTSYVATISGVNATSSDVQAITAYSSSSSATVARGWISGAGVMTVTHTSAATVTYWFSGDIALTEKPTWAVDYSNQVLSEDAGNRLIAASIYLAAATNHTSIDNAVLVPLDTVLFDTVSGWDSANKRWIAPETGYYSVSGSVGFSSLADTKPGYGIVKVSGSIAFICSAFNVGATSTCLSTGTRTLYLVKGQYVELFGYQNDSSSEAYYVASQSCSLTIHKVVSPQQIATSSKTYCFYTSNAGQSVLGDGSPATLVFEDKVADSDNAYNTSTGVYACQRSGILHLSVQYLYAAATTWAIAESLQTDLRINGTTVKRDLWYQNATSASNINMGSKLVISGRPVSKGDTIDVVVTQTSGGSLALISNAIYNNFGLTIE